MTQREQVERLPRLPFEEFATKDDLLLLTGRVWAPDEQRPSAELELLIISRQPWSPTEKALVQIKPKENNAYVVSILTLESGAEEVVLELPNATFFIPPAWSPNGRYLTYAVESQANSNFYTLYLYDLESGVQHALVEDIYIYDLAGFSFDSAHIAFAYWPLSDLADAQADTQPIVRVIDIHTGQFTEFETGDATLDIERLHWSPVALELIGFANDIIPDPAAASFDTYSYSSMLLLDLAVGAWIPIVEPSAAPAHPYYATRSGLYVNPNPWSADGGELVYSDSGIVCIFSFVESSSDCPAALQEYVVLEGGIGAEYPSFSPGGEWIAFVLKEEGVFCSSVALFNRVELTFQRTFSDLRDCSVFGPLWYPYG